MPRLLLFCVACLLFAVPAGLSAQGPPAPGDKDGDGVPDASDPCPNIGNEGVNNPAGPSGCPAVVIGAIVPDVTLEGLRKDKVSGQAQCRYTGRESCRVNVTLKLGKKKIADVDVDAKKGDSNIDGTYGNFKFGVSSAGRAALKDAKSAKVTFSGSYELGSAAAQKLPTKTYTVSGKTKFWVISNDANLNGKDGKPPSDE